MNWFTRGFISHLSVDKKQELISADGACEHVEKDINLATVLHQEKDSFGTVGSFVCCSACDDAIRAREDEEPRVCHDCSGTFPKKQTRQWRWYDFYAPQGDIPLTICDGCRTKPKHLDRVQRDKEDYNAEMGYEDDLDDRDDENQYTYGGCDEIDFV